MHDDIKVMFQGCIAGCNVSGPVSPLFQEYFGLRSSRLKVIFIKQMLPSVTCYQTRVGDAFAKVHAADSLRMPCASPKGFQL